jgi:hypothetical protein
VISHVARPLLTQDKTDTEEMSTDIHALSWIRTHDSIVLPGEGISWLRPCGHWDRLVHTSKYMYSKPKIFISSVWNWDSPCGTAATTGLFYQFQMIDDGDCGAISGLQFGRGNRSTRRKPAPATLCPPQIPHDQTQPRTWAAAVGSQWLTAWAMARPISSVLFPLNHSLRVRIFSGPWRNQT